MITLPVINNHDVVIFQIEDLKKLRKHGVCSTFIGTLAHFPQQNVFMSVPMRLMIWEALWLVQENLARLVDYKAYRAARPLDMGEPCTIENDEATDDVQLLEQYQISPIELARRFIAAHPEYTDAKFVTNYTNYVHLKRKHEFYLSPGLRFGGDLVSYPGDPLKYHSYAVVRFQLANLQDLIVGGRLATSVKKTLLLIDDKEDTQATVDDLFTPRAKQAYSIEWAGFG